MIRSSLRIFSTNPPRFFGHKSEPGVPHRKRCDDANQVVNTKPLSDFSEIYPDFMQSKVWNRRVTLKDELERQDMLERRMNIDIPEFYVGSIVAVTSSDRNLGSKDHRFVGICIRREKCGLFHQFTLRNTIEKIGVEIVYDLYNPTIKKIETLKLEKRLDSDLGYLVDALPEYSTFDFHMESQAHPSGTPIPINEVKVKLNNPPWTRRWEVLGYKGIEDTWTQATPWFKRKLSRTALNSYEKYDIIGTYREGSTSEHELAVQAKMLRIFNYFFIGSKKRDMPQVSHDAAYYEVQPLINEFLVRPTYNILQLLIIDF